MNQKRINRREFLRASTIAVAGIAVSSCAPAVTTVPATEVPTSAPIVESTATAAATEAVAATPTTAVVKTAEDLLTAAGLPLPGAPTNPKGWKDKLPAVPEGMPLNPPIKITGTLTDNQTIKYAPGDNIDNNQWSRMIKAIHGIEIEAKYTSASDDDALQKLNMAMAVDDIPDMLLVSSATLTKLVEAGQIQDLTDAIDKYASEEYIKKPLNAYGKLPWGSSTIDGKVYGLPYTEMAAQNDKLMWIRQDWLDKLGLKVPTTLDELANVALEFKKAGLGQGAAGTTIGLLANKAFTYAWFGSLDPVWGGYGIIPGYWSEQDGKLVNGMIRPEAKECLSMLAKWYKDGVIASDFYTIEQDASQQFVAGNQCGLHFTPFWTPSWGVKESVDNDPSAVWTFNDIPAGPTGIKKKHWSNPFPGGCWVVSKKFQNVPELFKYLNWAFELIGNPETRFFTYTAWENVDFTIENGVLKANGLDYSKWMHLLDDFVNPKTNAVQAKWIQDNWAKLAEGERDAQMNYFLNVDKLQQMYNGAEAFAIEHSDDQAIREMFTGIATQTMVDKGTELGTNNGGIGTMATKVYIDIITGQKPVSTFDDFVTQWKSLGGDQMTAEVNDWYSKSK